MREDETGDSKNQEIRLALEREHQKFQESYTWLEQAMPADLFHEMSAESILLIAHSLVRFDLQDYFSIINSKHSAIAICLDSADADIRILKNFASHGIQNYHCYISSKPPPLSGCTNNIRIAIIHFTEALTHHNLNFPTQSKETLFALMKKRDPELSDDEFNQLFSTIDPVFLRALNIDRLSVALAMFFRAKTRDSCQYEVCDNQDWQASNTASMQIVLAWKNTPKYNFLYQLANVIHCHNLVMKGVNATYVEPYNRESILIMAIDLHGADGKAAWEASDIPEFLRAFATAKYFGENDVIDTLLVERGLVSGNNGNLLRTMAIFIHQALLQIDQNLYTLEKIKEDLCRHPELTVRLCEAFSWKFHPQRNDISRFHESYEQFENHVNKLDTGSEKNDTRRKNVLRMGMSFIKHTYKTNFFRTNYTAMSFRVDPKYLNEIPFDRTQKFPVLPYGIFFIRGLNFFGYHIRFKRLSRGGLRTVYLEQPELLQQESNNVFTECYNLALTQHMKNKDIPEGGSKAIIFLKPWDRLDSEALILQNELKAAGTSEVEIKNQIDKFRREQKEEHLHQAQRAFIEGLMIIINYDSEGKIRAKNIVDYLKQPEEIYLGPDENMHDSMIIWIARFSKKYGYKPGSAFISGKPKLGINHKQFGVTSLGVNVYMEAVLSYLGIDPKKDIFTVKISGGPDGDVAGNQILNLLHHYPKTAKIVALTDISGTINDPKGLDLPMLAELFHQGKPIRSYSPDKLSDGGFLLDRQTKRSQTSITQQTLCWKMVEGKLTEEWMPGNEMNHLFRSNVHQTYADMFIPGGGRPRTLNETNVNEYLDALGKPTSKAIVEGANLYLTPGARHILEKLGVLIIKDSSANKTGVICSSFEVLCTLALGDETFLAQKEALIKEILERLVFYASKEAGLLLNTHDAGGGFLTDISDEISRKINLFTYQLLDYLDTIPLKNDPDDLLMQSFFNYCLPTLHNKFQKELLAEISDHHKKAIIACHLGAQLVYNKGLSWTPTIIEVLPILLGRDMGFTTHIEPI